MSATKRGGYSACSGALPAKTKKKRAWILRLRSGLGPAVPEALSRPRELGFARPSYKRSTFAGDVVWLAMLIRPFDTWDCDDARGGTPMAARSMTALTSALRRMRL
jgi:hypothetical protein